MNEMRCVNMHSPVLLFIPRSSQPAEPQIPTEEKTFWMRMHCGFPCQNSAGHEGCVSAYSLASFRSGELWGFLGSTTEQPVLSGMSSDIHWHIHSASISVKHIWLFVSSWCLPAILSITEGALKSGNWHPASFSCGGFI